MADRLYLDANVLISIVELSDRLGPQQVTMLSAFTAGNIVAVSSDLALAECLVKPMTDGDTSGIDAFVGLFDSGSLDLIALDREVLVETARLRATLRMKLPDAMHVAAASVGNCTGFVTADNGVRLPQTMRRIPWNALADFGEEG